MIVDRVRTSVPDAHVLVDDNSPDGTGRLADQLAAEDAHIHVLHRTGEKGLGAAHIAGFRWALDEGFSAVAEMDADGSHQPEQLRFLLAALDHADLVIGSRWVPGGQVINWPKSRHSYRGVAIPTRASCWTSCFATSPPGIAFTGPRHYGGSAWRTIAGILLPGGSDGSRLAGRSRCHRRAHHVRGARRRDQQDERGRHRWGAVEAHPVGDHRPMAQACHPSPSSLDSHLRSLKRCGPDWPRGRG